MWRSETTDSVPTARQAWVITRMDELERRINAYRSRTSVRARLTALQEFALLRDPRVVPFLLEVLEDRNEAEEVRIYVLKELRNGDGLLEPAGRPRVAEAIGDVLTETSNTELRLQAALALGELVEIEGVIARLGEVCFAQDESLDLRYAAFTALERAGPAPECVTLLKLLSTDRTLGRSARSVLSAWHVA
jgi:hypothetical protein